jgi:hypothetical protein
MLIDKIVYRRHPFRLLLRPEIVEKQHLRVQSFEVHPRPARDRVRQTLAIVHGSHSMLVSAHVLESRLDHPRLVPRPELRRPRLLTGFATAHEEGLGLGLL